MKTFFDQVITKNCINKVLCLRHSEKKRNGDPNIGYAQPRMYANEYCYLQCKTLRLKLPRSNECAFNILMQSINFKQHQFHSYYINL